ncbi:hypothetical protein JW859_14495 [bacterium]|nr:hypothetical protein [bacterium]
MNWLADRRGWLSARCPPARYAEGQHAVDQPVVAGGNGRNLDITVYLDKHCAAYILPVEFDKESFKYLATTGVGLR